MPLKDTFFIWKFTGKFLENDEAVILVNSLLPKKVAWLAILPILKELSKPYLDSQIGAKTLVKKNWRNLQFLSALYQGTEGMGCTVMPEKNKKKWSYRLCKFWCRTKIYLNTETARKHHRTYPAAC
jgi:hypothetical protein